MNLDENKAIKKSGIPINIVKKSVDILCNFVFTSFNSSVKTSKFLGNLKLADITLLCKKG